MAGSHHSSDLGLNLTFSEKAACLACVSLGVHSQEVLKGWMEGL